MGDRPHGNRRKAPADLKLARFVEARIVGAILITRQQDAPHVTAAVKDGRDVSGLREALERGEWEGLAAAEPVAV